MRELEILITGALSEIAQGISPQLRCIMLILPACGQELNEQYVFMYWTIFAARMLGYLNVCHAFIFSECVKVDTKKYIGLLRLCGRRSWM